MNEKPSHIPRGLDIELARRIDAVCRRFEADWRAGRHPRIEDYLSDFAPERQAALQTELEALMHKLGPAREDRPETEGKAGSTPDAGTTPPCAIVEAPTIEPAAPLTVPVPGEAPDSVHEDATIPPHRDRTIDLTPVAHDMPTTAHGQAAQADADVSEPVRVRYFGDYEIIREIARGGMGVVFQARQITLNRPVALKMILTGQLADETDVRRFYTEAEAAANLDHPGIVPVYEVGQHEGQHYFSMGYVEGQSLSQRLAGGPLPAREAAELIRHVAEAIEYAHQRGVIHRDLKPANILLDRNGNARVTDFGLAKKIQGDSGLTGSGQIMGTPSYMPPEQAGGKRGEVGPAADVYALGATIYALVTGRPPFHAATAMDTVIQVLSDEPVPPRRLNPSVPRDLETICLKCLQKDPAKRYVGAAALGEDLRRFLSGEPITARTVGRAEKSWRWCQRNPAVAALAGGIALTLVAGTIVATYFALRATRGERLALQNAAEARAVLSFLRTKVLAAARPKDQEGGLGINATVREAVDAAEADIQQSFADQPTVEASIRSTLGSSYRYLGEPKRAVRQDQRGLELRQKFLGLDHPDTLQAMTELARSYFEAGRIADSLSLSEQALKRIEGRLGPNHPDTLEAVNNLATAYQATGRFADGLALFERRLNRLTQIGPDHVETLVAMDNLAGAYRDAGRVADALRLHDEALKRFKTRLGPDHPDTLVAMNNLALAYKDAGQLAKALPLYEETLKLRRTRLGASHPFSLQSMNNLAQAYRAADRLREALPLYEQALAGRQAQLGADHPHTLHSMKALARACLTADPTRAERILRTALAIHEKNNPDEWVVFETRSLLGDSLLQQKKYAEAEDLLLSGYDGLKSREDKIPGPYKKGLAEAGSRLIRLYEEWGKKARADEWRAKLNRST
jgi:tetratricopeptide (TPR) repeat protein